MSLHQKLDELEKLAKAARENENKKVCVECEFNFIDFRHAYGCSKPEIEFKLRTNPETTLELISALRKAIGTLENVLHSSLIREREYINNDIRSTLKEINS
jgi:hypothetical protein